MGPEKSVKLCLILLICFAAITYTPEIYNSLAAFLPDLSAPAFFAAALNTDMNYLNGDFNNLNTDVNKPGSGNGGGGGGTSGEEFENILISETQREYVNINSAVSYSFKFEDNIVRYINFTGLKSSGQITSKVEILNHTSSLVDNNPPEIVYKNLNIWVGNLGWADSNIANARVNFKVEQSWIAENDIDTSTISLNRYSGGKWTTLQTAGSGKDDVYLYFEAKTPGFSPFSVSGTKNTAGKPGTDSTASPAAIQVGTSGGTDRTAEDIPGFGSTLSGVSFLLALISILKKNRR